jgi:adenylate cyclase
LAADIAGYDRLISADVKGTLSRLKTIRKELADTAIAVHRGRIVKTTGGSMLVEFASAVDAVQCAVQVQRGMAERNQGVPPDTRIEFRIGLHVGDIIIDDNDIFGDSVNIAVRLQGIAEPGGVCISDDAHRQIRGKVEYDWEDLGPQTLKNIAELMRAWWVNLDGQSSGRARPASSAVKAPVLALPDKPSIAALPFQNMSGDPEQEYFADGLVEDIITALSRYKSLFVIARNSSFTYKGRAVDIRQVGRELGVRYVLEGSVRKAGSRLRITGQLIDCSRGFHLWAEKFEGALEEVFELQDRVASGVAGVIDPLLLDMEIKRASDRPTADLTAYDLYLRAYAMYSASHQRQMRQALALLEEAIARDPQYGPALAFAAYCCMQLVSDAAAPDRDTIRQKGIDFGRRAVELAENVPGVLADAAMALASFGEEIDAMIALVDRALAFNPSYARGWHISGFLRLWAGQTDLAIEHAGLALRLSPRAQARLTSLLIGYALFFSRRFEEAVPRLRVAIEDSPLFPTPYRFLAACYAHMGLLDEARATIARLRAITPEVMVNYPLPFRDPRHRELYFSGLRLAVGEET